MAVALTVGAAERAAEPAELAHESLLLIVAAALVGAVLFATAHGEEPHRVVLSIGWIAYGSAYLKASCIRPPPPDSGKNPRDEMEQGAPPPPCFGFATGAWRV